MLRWTTSPFAFQIFDKHFTEKETIALSQLPCTFGKIFFGGNGVKDGIVMTSSVAEAYTQKMALEHSVESYLLLDSSKVGKEDFSKLCHLSDLTAVVMEESNEDKKQAIQVYTELIV